MLYSMHFGVDIAMSTCLHIHMYISTDSIGYIHVNILFLSKFTH